MTAIVETQAENIGFVQAQAGARGMLDVASSRQAQEVQAAMVIAKKFPRNEAEAFARIMRSCQRPGLANCAVYTYPRGKETVNGPSIRLAEELARAWGNVDFGITELEQKNGESVCQSYCWDLETNTRQTKVFTVKHERHTKTGAYKLTDPRDIYEMVANQGARRLRACILGVIPGDVVDAAVDACEKTLAKGGGGEPLLDRVRKMVAAFSDMGVTSSEIEGRLGHRIAATTEPELAQLRKIFASMKDNMATKADFFSFDGAHTVKADKVAEKIAVARGKRAAAPAQVEVEPEASVVMVEQEHPAEEPIPPASVLTSEQRREAWINDAIRYGGAKVEALLCGKTVQELARDSEAYVAFKSKAKAIVDAEG